MHGALGSAGYGALTGDVLSVLRDAGEKILTESLATLQAAGVPADSALFESLQGRLCDRFAHEIREWKAERVVLGTHGRRRGERRDRRARGRECQPPGLARQRRGGR